MQQKSEYINYFVATLSRNDISATKIRDFLVTAWGEENVSSLRRIQEIAKEYRDGQREFAKRKVGSGRPITVANDDNVERIKALVTEDATLSIRSIAQQIEVSEKTVHRILRMKLCLKSVNARWVPHILTDAQQRQRVECAQRLLEELNGNVVITDEKWLFCNPLPPRQQRRSWVMEDGDRPKLPKRIIADKKFHIIVAVTFRGDFNFSVLNRNESINSERYIRFLEEKVLPIRRNITLMHDNARPHTSISTGNFLTENNVTLLGQAPYSPDFNLLDRYIFRNLEYARRNVAFSNRDEVVNFIQEFMVRKVTREKLHRELQRLRNYLEDVIAVGGDYL